MGNFDNSVTPGGNSCVSGAACINRWYWNDHDGSGGFTEWATSPDRSQQQPTQDIAMFDMDNDGASSPCATAIISCRPRLRSPVKLALFPRQRTLPESHH